MEGNGSDRSRALERLAADPFDVLVVGGGITGSGIARDAALAGLRVALVERDDFGSGTSSRSSRLVHGGLRYLEQMQLGLVAESTRERARLMRLASHLVRPMPFLYPAYRHAKPGRFMLSAGMWLYDGLALFRNYRRHHYRRAAAASALEPRLRREGLRGAFLYYDCATDDARLTLENVLDAEAHGAIAVSRARFVKLLTHAGGGVRGAVVEDGLGGQRFEVAAGLVIVAAGPWSDEVLPLLRPSPTPCLRPTKGVHAVFSRSRLPVDHAVVMIAPRDRRVGFAIPWRNVTYVGTTDTDFTGDPARAQCEPDDLAYVLETANAYFPEAQLGPSDVIATWAGVRPLIRGAADTAYKTSREHDILTDPAGWALVAGGKLTTYRLMARQTLEEAWRAARNVPGRPALPPSRTGRAPLPGAAGVAPQPAALCEQARGVAAGAGLSEQSAEHLVRTYGVRAAAVMAPFAAEPTLAAPLVEGQPHVWAEVAFALNVEHALSLEDFFVRRTALRYLAPQGSLAVAEAVAQRFATALHWPAERVAAELAAYRTLVERDTRR